MAEAVVTAEIVGADVEIAVAAIAEGTDVLLPIRTKAGLPHWHPQLNPHGF